MLRRMIVSELPTLETSGAVHDDSDDDSDDDGEGDVILDVRAARQKAKAGGIQKEPSVANKFKHGKKKEGRLREASWKVLELLLSPQKHQPKPDPPARPKDATPRWPVGGPDGGDSGAGLHDRMVRQPRKSSSYKEQLAALTASSLTLGTDSGNAQRENALLVPLAASSSPARRLPNMMANSVNTLDAQPLGLPPFRSVSGTSAVSSVASERAMDLEVESPLAFSANEEAMMDAILGL